MQKQAALPSSLPDCSSRCSNSRGHIPLLYSWNTFRTRRPPCPTDGMGHPGSGSSLSEEPACQVTLACLLHITLQRVVQLGGVRAKELGISEAKEKDTTFTSWYVSSSVKRVCCRHVSLVTALIPSLKHLQHVWAIYKCSSLLFL